MKIFFSRKIDREKSKLMRDAQVACQAAGIRVPSEILEYFAKVYLMEFQPDIIRGDVSGTYSEIKISSLDEWVHSIRVYNND